MQNYHTSPQEPLTAILEALRTADPKYGVTAVQIATRTNLNLVETVIPALRGFLRSDVIIGSPVQQSEGMSFVLRQPAQPAPPGSGDSVLL